MKDYFNKEEQAKHLALIACQTKIEEVLGINAPSEEEKTYLRYALTYLKKFDKSVYSRMGIDYKNKMERTANDSKVVVARKTEAVGDILLDCDYNTLVKMARKLQEEHCWLCEKECHKDCEIYNMAVTLGLDEVKDYNGEGCPFKI